LGPQWPCPLELTPRVDPWEQLGDFGPLVVLGCGYWREPGEPGALDRRRCGMQQVELAELRELLVPCALDGEVSDLALLLRASGPDAEGDGDRGADGE